MRRPVLFLLGTAVLLCPPARAAEPERPQLRLLPGNAWNHTGAVSPMEPGNILSHTHAEQGLVLWRHNRRFLSVLAAADIDADSKGYDWNNKREFTGGIRFTQAHAHGWVRVNAGYSYERRNSSGLERSGPTGSLETWTSWHPFVRPGGAFPGNVYALAGNVSTVERGNLLGVVDVQQGVALISIDRARLIPYVQVSAMADTDGHDWGNRRTAAFGMRFTVPLFLGGMLESGVARRYEYRPVSGSSSTATVWFTSVGCGWSPPIGGAR